MILQYLSDPEIWAALLTIMGVNIVLSGDNAVVIALACRNLPAQQKKMGIICGTGAAVVLRVVFAAFIAFLMTVPYLKLVGGALLFWVAYKLAVGDDGNQDIDPAKNLWHAVRIVVIADAVMSLDNVIAVAAVARGNFTLLTIGLALSIPIVVAGATVLLRLIDRYPVIVPGGAALIGFIGGEVIETDPVLVDWIEQNAAWLHHVAPLAGAVGVLAVGSLFGPVKAKPAPAMGEVTGEVAAGAAVFLSRALLVRLAALIVGAVAFGVADAGGTKDMGVLGSVMLALRPVFAAVIAILVSEALGRARQYLRRRNVSPA